MGKRFGSIHGLSMDIGGRIALGPSGVRFAGFAKPANAGIWIPPLLGKNAPLGRKKGMEPEAMSKKKPTSGDRAKKSTAAPMVRSSAAEYLTLVAASGQGGVEAVYAE